MARIAGIDVPLEKRIEISLTYVYGIGRTTSKKILEQCGIDLKTRTKDLAENELALIRGKIEEMGIAVEGELKRTVSQNIRRLMDTKSYRGLRHKAGLPVRGQKTRSNARTRKGKKKTVGGQKKKLTKK